MEINHPPGDECDFQWSPVSSFYLLRQIPGVSRRVQFRRLIFNSSLRIIESARKTQDTIWCATDEAQEIYALPGESLDVRRLSSTGWEFACSLAMSSENRQIALVRNGGTSGWLLEGLQTTSSMLGHRMRYAGSIREDPSGAGIWCLEHVPSHGVSAVFSEENLFELDGERAYPDYLPSKIFKEAQAALVYVAYTGEVYRTSVRGVVTDLVLQWEDGVLNFGLCRTLPELSRYLAHGECPYFSVSTDELGLEYERTVSLQRVGARSVRDELTSILARNAVGPAGRRISQEGNYGVWIISLQNGIEPVLPADGTDVRTSTDGSLTESVPRYTVQRGNFSCAVTASAPAASEGETPLIWFDVLNKARLSEVTDFYFNQLTGGIAARPSSVERIHGVDRPVVRVFVDIEDVISHGAHLVLTDALETVETLHTQQLQGSIVPPGCDVFIGGASFGAALAVSVLSLGWSGAKAAMVRSGCYHRGLIAGGIEGRRIERQDKSSVYQDLSISWDNRSLQLFPPVLVVHGENDEYYPTGPAQAHGFVERLHEAGVKAWLLELSGEGHALGSVEGIENLARHERSWLSLHSGIKQSD